MKRWRNNSEARAEEGTNTNRIKEAALSLFAEQGYETTTIDQIAKLSGIA